MIEDTVLEYKQERFMESKDSDRITWLISNEAEYTKQDGKIGYYKTGIYSTAYCYVYRINKNTLYYYSDIISLMNAVLRNNIRFGIKRIEYEHIRSEIQKALRLIEMMYKPLSDHARDLEIKLTDAQAKIEKFEASEKWKERTEQKVEEPV